MYIKNVQHAVFPLRHVHFTPAYLFSMQLTSAKEIGLKP